MDPLGYVIADLRNHLGERLVSALCATPSTLVLVAFSTSFIYLFLVVFMQFSRRPFAGQSSMFDLVFMLVIANGVQNAMVLGDNSLVGGLVAALTLFAWDSAIGWIRRHHPRSRRFLGGERIQLVQDGKPIEERLAREHVDLADLMAILQRNGFTHLDQVCDAYLEVDGSITLVPYPDAPTQRRSQVVHRRGKR